MLSNKPFTGRPTAVIARFASVVLLTAVISPGARAQTGLDLAFCMDGSGSIDQADFALQKQGIISALQNTQLVPRDGTIAFTLIQFGNNTTRVEVPYTLISSESDANNIVSQIAVFDQIGGGTNPGDAVNAVLRRRGKSLPRLDCCPSPRRARLRAHSRGGAVKSDDKRMEQLICDQTSEHNRRYCDLCT